MKILQEIFPIINQFKLHFVVLISPTPLYPNNDNKILPLTIPQKCQAKKTTLKKCLSLSFQHCNGDH